MERLYRAEIWWVGHDGHEKANNQVSHPPLGGQGQVGGPQVSFLGNGEVLES